MIIQVRKMLEPRATAFHFEKKFSATEHISSVQIHHQYCIIWSAFKEPGNKSGTLFEVPIESLDLLCTGQGQSYVNVYCYSRTWVLPKSGTRLNTSATATTTTENRWGKLFILTATEIEYLQLKRRGMYRLRRVFFFLVNRVDHQKRTQTATKWWPFGFVFGVQLGLRHTQALINI